MATLDLSKLKLPSYQAAVEWYQNVLGAQVVPGPQLGDISIITEQRAPDGKLEAVNTQVVPDHMLQEMAAISMAAHARNHVVSIPCVQCLNEAGKRRSQPIPVVFYRGDMLPS